jgi:hypothetical protein
MLRSTFINGKLVTYISDWGEINPTQQILFNIKQDIEAQQKVFPLNKRQQERQRLIVEEHREWFKSIREKLYEKTDL